MCEFRGVQEAPSDRQESQSLTQTRYGSRCRRDVNDTPLPVLLYREVRMSRAQEAQERPLPQGARGENLRTYDTRADDSVYSTGLTLLIETDQLRLQSRADRSVVARAFSHRDQRAREVAAHVCGRLQFEFDAGINVALDFAGDHDARGGNVADAARGRGKQQIATDVAVAVYPAFHPIVAVAGDIAAVTQSLAEHRDELDVIQCAPLLPSRKKS